MLTSKQKFQRRIMTRLVPKMESWHRRLEASVAARPGVVKSGPTSPEQVNILLRAMEVDDVHAPPGFPHSVRQLVGSMWGIKTSVDELEDNPENPLTRIDEDGITELEEFAKNNGALSIGYAVVEPRLVFKNKAVLHPYAIVLSQEMDKERIDTAPSPAAGLAVHETYNQLGQVSNEVARYLRARGYSAHAGHPLGGYALYPPLGQAAQLGWRGIHGLLITPEFGPTVRLTAVFTSIENLPLPQGNNPHEWVEEFCDHCRLCIRKCPVEAIYTEPIVHQDGRLTCANDAKCLPYFAVNHGCSICVAVCPFNKVSYDRLYHTVRDYGHREAVRKFVGNDRPVDVSEALPVQERPVK